MRERKREGGRETDRQTETERQREQREKEKRVEVGKKEVGVWGCEDGGGAEWGREVDTGTFFPCSLFI